MFKVAVLTLLAVSCSALPYQTSYGRFGQSYGFSSPRVFNTGFRSGYGGLSSGLGLSGLGLSGVGLSGVGLSGVGLSGLGYGTHGYSLGGLRTGLSVAPLATTQTVVAAPAIQTLGYSGYSGINNLNLLNVHQGEQVKQVVPAAIQQISRTVEYRPFANLEQPIQTQVVEVEPSDNPVHLHFKTRSSTLSTSQSHAAAGPTEIQAAASQDEPQRLITEVQKPVIQEVKEVISPFRQVTQEINPVVESLHTIVTKGDGYRQQQFVAPAINTQAYQSWAAPAINTVAVAPALQTVAVQAAPVVESVAVAPIATSTYGNLNGYGANIGSTSQLRIGAPTVSQIGWSNSGLSKPLTNGYSSIY